MNYKILKPESFPYVVCLAVIFILIHLITGSNYPVFRDEFYYLDCANHLAAGYVDHPPLSIYLLAVWKFVFGDSLISLRILPAIAGAITVYITAVMVSLMGGSRFAQISSALCVVFVPNYLGTTGFYSMNAFDTLFWSFLFLILLQIINSGNPKLFILLGIAAGIGMLNKISIGFFIISLVFSLLLTPQRKYLLSKYFWIGGIISAIIFLPYIIWNIQNNYATFEFIQNASKYKIAEISAPEFFKAQILGINPFYSFIWLTGLFSLIFTNRLKKYRLLSFIYLFTFLILIAQNSKPYYLAASYTVLFSSGVLIIVSFIENRKNKYFKYAFTVYTVIAGLLTMPFAVPVLPPEKFVSYSNMLGITPQNAEKSRLGALPQHFADRFGWEELTEIVAGVYNSLPKNEKTTTGIFAQNYGEAGAVNYYGKKYNLPVCNSGHNNHWLWGPRHDSLRTFIIIGGRNESDYLESFEEVEKVGTHVNLLAMPFENNLPVFLCRKIKKPIKEIWHKTKKFI